MRPPSSSPAKPSPPAAPAPGVAASRCGVRVSGRRSAGATRWARPASRMPDQVRGGALLRAVDGGGPVGSGQRVLHVAGDDDLDAGQVGQAGECRSIGSVAVRRRSMVSACPASSRKTAPSAASMPAAAVGAGRSAEGQHDPAGVAPQQRDDGLADALAGGFQRGEFPAGQGVQAAGVGDLDDGGGAVERGDGGALVAGGPGDGDRGCGRNPASMAACDAAVPAVGERQSGVAGCPRSVSPLPRCWTTSAAVRLPLNLSGARRTFMTLSLLRRR